MVALPVQGSTKGDMSSHCLLLRCSLASSLFLLWITCIMSAPVEQPSWLETKSPSSSQVSKRGRRPSAPVSPGHTSCRALSPKCLPAKPLLPVPDLGDRGRSRAQCWLGSFAAQ